MPLQNRVLPTQDIVAIPARGTLTGNRGILHRGDRTLGTARWTHKAWICCTLDWNGVRRPVMTGRTWTELFFLDEATAMAAGHRPCALCRRASYLRFRAAWAAAMGKPVTDVQMDAKLHEARIRPGTRQQRRYLAPLDRLPLGTFVIWNERPHLLSAAGLLAYHPGGYDRPVSVQKGAEVIVLTPAPLVAAMSAGYLPGTHPSAVD